MAQHPIVLKHDLHCHILPEWDDGPRELEGSLELARRAVEFGIESIVATPHVGRSFNNIEHPASSIAAGVERLQQELDARAIPLKIFPGAEIMLGAVDVLNQPNLLPEWTYCGAGRYILVESPLPGWPDFGDNLIYETALRGATPIVAHPERYVNVQKDVRVIERAVSQGALLQVTAGSLRRAGGQTRQCAMDLLHRGWVHLVASDAHSAKNTLPHEVVELLLKEIGEARTRQILEENPARVMAGKPLRDQLEAPRKRPSWLKKLTIRG